MRLIGLWLLGVPGILIILLWAIGVRRRRRAGGMARRGGGDRVAPPPCMDVLIAGSDQLRPGGSRALPTSPIPSTTIRIKDPRPSGYDRGRGPRQGEVGGDAHDRPSRTSPRGHRCVPAARPGHDPGVCRGSRLPDKLPFGAFMNKGLTMKTGQTHMHRYMRPLLDKVANGEVDPSFVITHKVRLDDAPKMYKTFRDKKDGCIKVVLKPCICSEERAVVGKGGTRKLAITAAEISPLFRTHVGYYPPPAVRTATDQTGPAGRRGRRRRRSHRPTPYPSSRRSARPPPRRRPGCPPPRRRACRPAGLLRWRKV